MSTYSIHLNTNNRLPEWEVFENPPEGNSTWLASFGSEADAKLFAKIKQINEILTS